MLRFQRIDGTSLGTGAERNVIKNIVIDGTVPQIIARASELIGSQLREYGRLDKGGKFFPEPEYPYEAWIEVIVNACAHRSYSLRGSNILVRMFDDRLVVESPGGFPALVNPSNIYETHYRRNWWLMDALFYMNYVLCEAEGAKRIRKAMAKMGLPEPIFEQKESNDALVRVTLRNLWQMRTKWIDFDVATLIGAERAEKLVEPEPRIVNYVAEHGSINVSQAMNFAPEARWHRAKRWLDNLCKLDILVHVSRYSRDSSARYVFSPEIQAGLQAVGDAETVDGVARQEATDLPGMPGPASPRRDTTSGTRTPTPTG